MKAAFFSKRKATAFPPVPRTGRTCVHLIGFVPWDFPLGVRTSKTHFAQNIMGIAVRNSSGDVLLPALQKNSKAGFSAVYRSGQPHLALSPRGRSPGIHGRSPYGSRPSQDYQKPLPFHQAVIEFSIIRSSGCWSLLASCFASISMASRSTPSAFSSNSWRFISLPLTQPIMEAARW